MDFPPLVVALAEVWPGRFLILSGGVGPGFTTKT